MAKHNVQRDNSRYQVLGPISERSYEINETTVGTLMSVPMDDLKTLGLAPDWNPYAFISGKSMKSNRGKYVFLVKDDARIFSEVYEQAVKTSVKTHPKGNNYPLHICRLVPFHDEIAQREDYGLPECIPYGCSLKKSRTRAVTVYNPILQSITDFIMYCILWSIMERHTVQGPKMLETGYRMLRTWIRSKTPALSGTFYDDKTRMMWVYQFRTAVPICPTCHREFGRLKNIHLSKTYPAYQSHCSSYCSGHDPYVRAKVEETSLSRYGTIHAVASKIVKERIRKTNLARYGVEQAFNAPEIRERVRKTNLSKFGVEYPLQNKDMYKKTQDTVQHKYGVTNTLFISEIRRKAKETLRKHYGVSHPLQSKTIQDRVRRTCLERYGVDHPAKTVELIDKIVTSRIRNQRNGNKPKEDGLVFDSSWELKFYQFCKSRGMKIEYHPCRIDYEYEGRKFHYYPDFRVDGKLYEVKGDCFINQDGTWKCPFRSKRWSDRQYAFACGQLEAKRQCVLSNGVTVISGSQIKDLNKIFGD